MKNNASTHLRKMKAEKASERRFLAEWMYTILIAEIMFYPGQREVFEAHQKELMKIVGKSWRYHSMKNEGMK